MTIDLSLDAILRYRMYVVLSHHQSVLQRLGAIGYCQQAVKSHYISISNDEIMENGTDLVG